MVHDGREAAIERMLSEHGDRLLRLCYLLLSDIQLAEDALQETFLRAFKGLDAFRGDSGEATWLTRIAINACRDLQRGSWFRRVDRRAEPPERGVPFDEPDDSLVREIRRLPLSLRRPLVLFYYQDMNTHEIAQALGISGGAVATRLHRARAMLKDRMKGWDAP